MTYDEIFLKELAYEVMLIQDRARKDEKEKGDIQIYGARVGTPIRDQENI